jgi:pimeloyl-ACP methyl ester carboxylesterase
MMTSPLLSIILSLVFLLMTVSLSAMAKNPHKPKLIHRYATVNGLRLHYVAAGKGRPILFLHGFPEFWYAWKKQLEEFGRDYRAIALDMRGYNLSAKPAAVEEYRLDLLVEDVRALIEHLKAKPLTLVGHDWGGVVAWAFARTYPRSLERLIIINAPHPAIFERELRENPAQQRASQYMLLFRRPEAEDVLSANNYAALVQAVLAPGLQQGYFTEEDRKAYLAAWSQPGALTGGLNYYRAARIGPPTSAGEMDQTGLPQDDFRTPITVPTLVIWGEKDTALLTGNLNGLDRYVSSLTIHRIPDGSHWVVHEKPELVNSLIRAFLKTQPQ